MTDALPTVDNLATYLNQRFSNADTSAQKVKDSRKAALRYYRQDMSHIPSNEGESKIATSEVRDTIETLTPQMLEPFLTGAGPVTFEPTGEDDVKQAELETAYVNYVMFTQNDGFGIFTKWVKDGLLQKNGYVKAWRSRTVSIEPENYEGLSLDEADKVVSDNDAGQIVQQAFTARLPNGQTFNDIEQLMGVVPSLPPEMIQQIRVATQIVRQRVDEKTCIAPVAPENMIVEAGFNDVNLAKCNYCAERMFPTRGSLKAEGYPADLVDKLTKTSQSLQSGEAEVRASDQTNTLSQVQNLKGDDEYVEVREHYVRSDLDQSGIVKLWKVCTGGADSVVILSQEMVSRVPYHAWTPIIQAHQHYGTSAYELVNDHQDIHTVLWRQSLNAVVASNRVRPVVSEGGVGADTYDDLMKTVPGHPIRVRGDAVSAIAWTAPPNTALQTLPIMEYLQGLTESRTGLSKMAQGLDANSLADSTNMMGAMVMNQSLLRVKMMLRTFAETGVRSLTEHVRELTMKHEKREHMFEYMGEFVPIDPTDWRHKRNTVIRVGLGYNDRIEKVAALQSAYTILKDVIAAQGGTEGPIVTSENCFNLLEDIMKEQGLKTKGRYVSDPADAPPPPPPEPTPIDVAEAEIVSKNEIAAANNQVELVKAYLQDAREREKLGLQGVKTFAEIQTMVKAVNDNEQATTSTASQAAA